MIEVFIIRAVISSLLLSCMAGMLGSFITWQRMAYAGDSLSHIAMLGVAMALIFNMPILPCIILISIISGLLVVKLTHDQKLLPDSSLGLCAQFSIALSMIVISSIKSRPIDVMGFLFGDIIATTNNDIYLLLLLTILTIIWLCYRWNALILRLISQELLFVQKMISSKRLDLEFMLTISLLVAVAIKIVGILLISAFLIIPPLAAQIWRISPERTVLLAIVLGSLSTLIGVTLSYHYDLITGPTMVVSSVMIFTLSILGKKTSRVLKSGSTK